MTALTLRQSLQVVLLTDGGSNINPERTIPNAEELKGRGAELYVIAIGDQVDMNEIKNMASGTNEPYVFEVKNEGEAKDAARRFLNDICS